MLSRIFDGAIVGDVELVQLVRGAAGVERNARGKTSHGFTFAGWQKGDPPSRRRLHPCSQDLGRGADDGQAQLRTKRGRIRHGGIGRMRGGNGSSSKGVGGPAKIEDWEADRAPSEGRGGFRKSRKGREIERSPKRQGKSSGDKADFQGVGARIIDGGPDAAQGGSPGGVRSAQHGRARQGERWGERKDRKLEGKSQSDGSGRRRSYSRQKRRRAQPATMPETAGPPKPKADFPATTLQKECWLHLYTLLHKICG